MTDGQKWVRSRRNATTGEGQKIYGRANLPGVIAGFPPDPDSDARHRANLLIKTDAIRVVLVTMLEGGEMHEHSAPGPITVQVLTGSIDFSVEGESNVMVEGDLISLAHGVRHAVRGIKDGAFLLTIGALTHSPNPGGSASGDNE